MSKNLRIIKTSSEFSGETIANSLSDLYVAEKTKIAVEAISIKYDKLDILISRLKEKYGYKEYKFSTKGFNVNMVLEGETSMIFIAILRSENKVLVDIFEKDYESLQRIYNEVKTFVDHDEITLKITNIYSGGPDKIDYDVIDKTIKNFDNSDLSFYPYLDVNSMFEQFLHSDSNILFLCGRPGVGKTRLADLYCKFLIEKVTNENTSTKVLDKILDKSESNDDGQNIIVFTAKNENILSLDSFWNKIIKKTPALVFLDDLDFISKRTSENTNNNKNQFISQFLSFTEGIHRNSNKTKFIITTNRDFGEIDEALLRKGRCFDILNIQPLSFDEAKDIWESKDLDIDVFNNLFKDKIEILQCDLGDAIKTELVKIEHGINFKPYLLKDGISMVKTVNKEKKTGFLK